jgi:ABC-type dipeptide/oligopeptide/nickel transport system permease component
LTALVLSAVIGIPAGAALAEKDTRQRLMLNNIYTLMGLPPFWQACWCICC